MDIEDQDAVAGAGGAPSKPGRRRFASTGIKASGVILTLASPSAMATKICKAPSGFMSGSLRSSPGDQTVACYGRPARYWKDCPEAWPSGCYPTKSKYKPATTFASVFPGGSTSLHQNGTMMDVLKDTSSSRDPYDLGAQLVTAYLNVKSGKIDFLTIAQLKSIWYDLRTYGYYSPMAGTRWSDAHVAIYLWRTTL